MAAPSSSAQVAEEVFPPPRAAMGESTPTLEEEPERRVNTFLSSNPVDLCVCCNDCFIVPERTSIVTLFFGEYAGTVDEPGCYCRNSIFYEMRRVTRAMITVDLPNVKVADKRGSPLMVSGLVTYFVSNARRAAIDVDDPFRYVSSQAPAVLKRVVSQYPYESPDESEATLRNDSGEVSRIMKDTLQSRVQVAGVRVESFAINELSYAPEIAQSMLKRQQAGALIEARQRIVAGATDIAKSAIQDSAELLTPADKSKLLSNLLVVLVSDKDATPVVSL